jgi:membrane associated rhomboid family serine protease
LHQQKHSDANKHDSPGNIRLGITRDGISNGDHISIKYLLAFDLVNMENHLSFITNLFLHGGWLHLIMNMWFLWIFADNVEDRMGHGRFIVFYLLCGFIATWIQCLYTPELVVPVVGAYI